jgi:hypothetical protein
MLAPGANGTGSLTINNSLSLAGTLAIGINKSAGTVESVQGISSLTCGGTLTVTNLAGTFAAGDTFTLFSASSYSGSFSSISLPPLPSALQWNVSNLGVKGTISVVQSPWGQWMSQYFTPSQLADPTISGDMATPNGDGTPNLLKYAMGISPWAETPLPTAEDIETVAGNSYLRLTINTNPAATDISYNVEVTGDLSAGNWTSADTVVELNNGSQLVVRDNVPVGSVASRFIHLRVTHP